MAVNAVAPWEGELVWIGEVNRGKTNSGAEWKSVEFALKYTDSQMNEKEIVFSLFGAGKVGILVDYPIGTWLKVIWWPESNQGKNGKYYTKNNVIAVYKIDGPAKSADTKITAPSFPEQGTQVSKSEAWKNPYREIPPQEEPASDDLPFSQSPGV